MHPESTLCELEHVSKWYGPVIGLNDVSLQVGRGITGLVGHNGAGKSTLMKLMTGQLRPSLGQVRVGGLPAWSAEAKRHIGYCPDGDAFYEDMSGREFVRLIARLHGFGPRDAHSRTESVLQQVDMTERGKRRLATYSKGMRQRIKLAQALVHDPQLLVLDEPFNGVDPVGRLELVQLFTQLTQQGKAILISSHILEDMDTLADQVSFVCRGRLLASGTLDSIRAMLNDHPLQIRVTTPNCRSLAVHLLSLEMVNSVQLQGDNTMLLEVLRPTEFYDQFSRLIVERQIDVERLQVVDASTEAIFDYLMQMVLHPR